MTRVLIAYDGSAGAATALRACASLFPDAHASVATVPFDPLLRSQMTLGMFGGMSPGAVEHTLDALHAEARREADETAAQAIEQARTLGLDADALTLPPSVSAWTALLDAAHRVGADVLVCGSRGRGAFARAVLGSTSSSLLHETDVPLLVVPDGGGALDGPVVAAYDGSEGARLALQAVGRLLGGRATVVVHAWHPVYHRLLALRAIDAGAVDDLRESAATLHAAHADRAVEMTEDGVSVAQAAGLEAVGDTVEADDGAWRAVAASAQAHGAAVIAMGTRGLGVARSVLLGSVSSGLIQNAEVPVLVVPGNPEGTPPG